MDLSEMFKEKEGPWSSHHKENLRKIAGHVY